MMKIKEVMPQTAMIDEGSFSSYEELLGKKNLIKKLAKKMMQIISKF